MGNKVAKDILTSGEVGALWDTYQVESIAICGLNFFLQHVEDKEIKAILKKDLKLAQKRIEKVESIFLDNGQTIPNGFTEGDVNLEAPRLFSDELYLDYMLHTLQMQFFSYNMAMLEAVKWEVQQFYKEVMDDTLILEMETKELSKKKGIYLKAPSIPTTENVTYVQDNSFLTGWFGERRPLIASEISQLIFNAKRNALGQAVITAFAQVAQTKEVQKFFTKGSDISGKHLRLFTDKLGEDYLPSAALNLTDCVTTSTEAPFSEKLMMTFITSLVASSIGSYGVSMSMSPRHDIGAMYTKLMTDIVTYSNEGAKIMIEHNWLETPPMAADRKNLAKKQRVK